MSCMTDCFHATYYKHFKFFPPSIQTSTRVTKPLLSFLFYHHVFMGSDSKDIQEEVKKLPEFDGKDIKDDET